MVVFLVCHGSLTNIQFRNNVKVKNTIVISLFVLLSVIESMSNRSTGQI